MLDERFENLIDEALEASSITPTGRARITLAPRMEMCSERSCEEHSDQSGSCVHVLSFSTL